MAVAQTQYAAQGTLAEETFWYAGTDALLAGYNMCYDIAATVATTPVKTARGVAVTKPATANLMHYAGYVRYPVTGPSYVTLVTPRKNEVGTPFCHVNATVSTTALGCANNDYGLVSFADATLNLAFVGLAMETADTSSTAANKLVIFK